MVAATMSNRLLCLPTLPPMYQIHHRNMDGWLGCGHGWVYTTEIYTWVAARAHMLAASPTSPPASEAVESTRGGVGLGLR